MSTVLRHVGAILAALAVWWSAAVLIGLGLYAAWPPDLAAPDPGAGRTHSFMAGVSLGRHWQNFPGNVVGFIAALYTFRAMCRRSPPAAEPGAAADRAGTSSFPGS